MLINLKVFLITRSSKSTIFRILRVKKYKEVSVEEVVTSLYHIVMKITVWSLITETYRGQWA